MPTERDEKLEAWWPLARWASPDNCSKRIASLKSITLCASVLRMPAGSAATEYALLMVCWVCRRRNGSGIFGGVFGRYPSHFPMYWKEIVEFSFYFVETFALPFAILVFVFE
jgi:hypothetical protein